MFVFLRDKEYDPQVSDPLVIASDGSNAALFYCPVDPITQKGFSTNYGGYIRNDISLLAEMEDSAVAQDLIHRLNERPDDSISEDVASDFELMQGMRSRRCQTISEMVSYYDSMLELRDIRLAQQEENENEEKELEEKKRLKNALMDSMNSEEKDFYLKKKREKEIENLID